ncbi:anti-sigma regulatory factor [Duganella sp. CY15W]|uniref:anti-sigma regulatory factor n=1 Tax=Duganella sp. CY15W TaxID=2692172 RepID=UPI00136E3695|nr:anti-sigma regulatory factor [Duganella sp. CY15W]MYM31340.1 anti-sigma regulatory factor [Duganella sp. CY15W]
MNTVHAPDAVRFNSRLLRGGGQQVQSSVTLPLQTDEHVVGVRKLVREMALALKLSLVEQTKLVTAASELARNTIKYGGGGVVLAQTVGSGGPSGIRLVFADDGPGIADIEQALRDGYTSGGGLGLGLGGAKRLVDEFEIDSRSGEGTAVAILKWKK